MEQQQRKGLRLVLFPLPFQGHINPLLELATILHSKGFSITLIHINFNSPNPSNHPHFTFHSISHGLSETEATTSDAISLITLLNIKCVEPFRECLASLISNALDEPIACLISDAMFHFSRAVAENFKLPRLVIRTTSATSFGVFPAFPLLLEKGYLPIQDSRLEELVVEFPPLKVKDLPVIKMRDQEKFYELISRVVSETKASSGLIWNTFEELEQPALDSLTKKLSIPMFPIGPFHKYNLAYSSSSLLAEDQSSISWLNTQPPVSVIYVSFGSLAVLSEAEFLEIAWGLANSEQPFLWVVRPGLVHGSEWLEPLPNGFIENLGGRGHIVKWAPQQQVLAHLAVGAFWTHSGWNSTMECICEGVPMICRPSFIDQKVNAKFVSHVWNVGVQLEDEILERGEIERMITKLMKEKEGEEIRCRVSKLKDMALSCLKQGGSSYKYLDSLVNHIQSLGHSNL
ncbi:UDP-glycosyltransferase 76F1-like [Humulus lupulus]|uniref:UDP-glycosyltransferase 76F1-like n=1 Tax=Humulus lupulus TaxID=3486 RepID=UPI002B415375|nr:UDP-glycosyltransferase 76F1-like [Humulus lupulus]